MSQTSNRTPSPQSSTAVHTTRGSPDIVEPSPEYFQPTKPITPSHEPHSQLFSPQPLTSGDLARLTDLPTPTVRFYSPPPDDQGDAEATDPSSQTHSSQSQISPSPSPTRPENPDLSPASPLSQPHDPGEMLEPGSSLDDDTKGNHNNETSAADQNRILGGMTMAWEGTTAQGVQLYRRDTWAAGHKWRRHVRVIEGFPKAEVGVGTGAGIGRQGTW